MKYSNSQALLAATLVDPQQRTGKQKSNVPEALLELEKFYQLQIHRYQHLLL